MVIADSTSRWAEALREFANRNGDLPAEEGYPANLASELAAFYERAGRVVTLGGHTASTTVIGAVSPPGGDMTEPVTTGTQRFIRSLWLLDRDLAYARHYPAVSWNGSFARDADAVGCVARRARRPRVALAPRDGHGAARRGRPAGLAGRGDRDRRRCPPTSASCCSPVGCCATRCSSRTPCPATTRRARRPRARRCSGGVLDVVDACQRLVARGVAATTVEEADLADLVRVREEVGPGDAEGVAQRCAEVLARLEELT